MRHTINCLLAYYAIVVTALSIAIVLLHNSITWHKSLLDDNVLVVIAITKTKVLCNEGIMAYLTIIKMKKNFRKLKRRKTKLYKIKKNKSKKYNYRPVYR